MSDTNRDPLAELLAKHSAAENGDPIPVEPTSDNINNDPITNDEISNDDIDYGDNDMAEQIAAEEAAYEEERRQQQTVIDKDNVTILMPPDSKDKDYQKEQMDFQTDKLAIVTVMVNQVIAKYKLYEGGIPDVDLPEQGVLCRFKVMGELIDIYHNNGEVINDQFETMVLSNWIMPDGSRAIDNILSDGTIRSMTSNNTESERNIESNDDAIELPVEESAPTININVQPNTPVTVNVDDSIVANLSKTSELNVNVKEVQDIELLASTVIENSAQAGIISKYESDINQVPITLPLSGYRCVMRPINWFDFIKLAAPTSNNNIDNELKKWSVIYDHIENPSIGPFEDFEDFLKKTKYHDRELLMWGLLVATADDEETIEITCGNPNCKHKTKRTYYPREIVHLDEKKIPAWYTRVHEAAPGEDAKQIWEEVNQKRKRYQFPHSKIIVEFEEPSAYEFINNKLPLTLQLFKRYRPDDDVSELNPNDVSMLEFDYLSTNALYVSAMSIIKMNEKQERVEYRYTNWSDIEQIITKALDATDSGVLLKLIDINRSNATPVSFRISDINCPKCRHHEDHIIINDIGNSLLFQISQRLSNIQINLNELV